jgi:hypothetical protein
MSVKLLWICLDFEYPPVNYVQCIYFSNICIYLVCSTPIQFWQKNVAVEWLTLLPRIQEAPGSDVGPETSYPD